MRPILKGIFYFAAFLSAFYFASIAWHAGREFYEMQLSDLIYGSGCRLCHPEGLE